MGIPKTPQVPSSPKKKKSTTLDYLFKLEASQESPTDDLLSLISNCNTLFTFRNPSESPSLQDLKRHSLLHILSILRTSKSRINPLILSPLFSMISTNLFRSLPATGFPFLSSEYSFDDDAPPMVLSPLWPHLHIIYDILSVLIANIDPISLQSHIDNPFLLNLLTLFQSEDPRERDRLKNIYHQLYSKMTNKRLFMRRSMSNTFLHFVFEADRHCGIGELLEICGSIINGFTTPLKEEHKVFLMRVLIPLHKQKGMCMYYRELSYCVTEFVQKEPDLSTGVVKGILRCWPMTNCTKEILLIGELEDLVEVMEAEEFEKVAGVLCSQIARCLNSCNSQVAERALYIWNNEHFVRMAWRCIEVILPSLVQAIEKNINWHWNKSVQNLTASVKKMLEEMEPGLYSKCLEDLNIQETMAGEEKKRRKEMWKRLECAASDENLFQATNSSCSTLRFECF
ncbi:uncharacterized protein A4U43_C07F24380 [Asparagus officinalis]|uniref:Serine/threonine protein phosphatase 2A regulatory subunit n=1 Tax=Asparagus officinalis TaxID=4686 RepID=A0A5P1EEM9_ASPOF|nr:serine/threonine protein phosphatase 2A 57 kDa regulatory subunit B' beta isoform-like [Asparagus officinalis]ONK64312.1 uncharacterized protein A4U43_C07F24380 [Asparagus officinalis]